MKYIENKKYTEISQALHISVRTAIRWHKASIDASVYQLKRMGLSLEKLENLFCQENWILSVYNSFEKNENNESKKYNEFEILNKACREYKSLFC